MEKIKAAIAGAGNISGIYISNLLGMFSDTVELCAIADDVEEKARAAAEKYGIEYAEHTGALLERRDISMVVNLTPPAAHFSVAQAALEAGKHVYNEKPLCADLASAETLLETAKKNNLRVGCSPDTFLGAGLQAARKVLEDGWIGRPIAGTAFLMNHGPENWHPAPAFYYAKGGGPLFDMGPYYLTALVSLLGPVAAVTGNTAVSDAKRIITSQPKYGTLIPVETPTHISALLDFKNGARVSMIMSFDVWDHSLPHIEIYGSEGTMQLGDPNFFVSPVRVKRANIGTWRNMTLLDPPGGNRRISGDNWRGIGAADMAAAIVQGRPHRASGELGIHVLETMTRILESGEQGKRLEITRPTGEEWGVGNRE